MLLKKIESDMAGIAKKTEHLEQSIIIQRSIEKSNVNIK